MKKAHLNELIKLADELQAIETRVQEILDAEQEAWDKRSEAWQEGDKGQDEQSLIGALEDAVSDMSNARDTINNVGTGEI